MTGTMEIGRKLDGLEGSPDFRIGCTRECFQERGTSDRVILELTEWRITSPMVLKHMRNMLILTKSSPQADDLFIPKMMAAALTVATATV